MEYVTQNQWKFNDDECKMRKLQSIFCIIKSLQFIFYWNFGWKWILINKSLHFQWF